MWSFVQRLPLFRYMNIAANNVDLKRVKDIGPNAACMEWLLRNGSTFKLSHSDTLFKDYNKLPPARMNNQLRITEIHSVESSLMDHGLEHLKGLEDLRKLYISSNRFITNSALQKLSYVKDSLEELVLIDCPNINDNGIALLTVLKKLKHLELSYLLSVENQDMCVKKLELSLPDCEIVWDNRVVKPAT